MPEKQEEKKKLCPDCEKEISAEDSRCPHCGFAVRAYEEFERLAKVKAKYATPKKEKSKSFLDELFG